MFSLDEGMHFQCIQFDHMNVFVYLTIFIAVSNSRDKINTNIDACGKFDLFALYMLFVKRKFAYSHNINSSVFTISRMCQA